MSERWFTVYPEVSFMVDFRTCQLPVWQLCLPGSTASSIKVPIIVTELCLSVLSTCT